MSSRTVYHLTPYVNGWQVKQEGSDEREVLVDDKERAMQLAREQAKQHELSQVIVHKRDGTIEEEFTYGKDPRDIPG
jgi:hypothetical protein